MGKPRYATVAFVLACVVISVREAQAQNDSLHRLYTYYDVGYDGQPHDDWFFDHYRFDAHRLSAKSTPYLDYDSGVDRFMWEDPHPREARTDDSDSDNADVQKQRRTSGLIVQVKHVEVRGTRAERSAPSEEGPATLQGEPGPEKNLVVMLATTAGDRRLIVDLGPASSLQPLQIAKGDRIGVEGIVVRLRDRWILASTRLRKRNQSMEIERPAQRRHYEDHLALRDTHTPDAEDHATDDEHSTQIHVSTQAQAQAAHDQPATPLAGSKPASDDDRDPDDTANELPAAPYGAAQPPRAVPQ